LTLLVGRQEEYLAWLNFLMSAYAGCLGQDAVERVLLLLSLSKKPFCYHADERGVRQNSNY